MLAFYPLPLLFVFSTRIQVNLHFSLCQQGTGLLTHAHLLSHFELVEKVYFGIHGYECTFEFAVGIVFLGMIINGISVYFMVIFVCIWYVASKCRAIYK